jgi:hypothetical protein
LAVKRLGYALVEYRQVILYKVPDEFQVDAVVLLAKLVANASDIVPRRMAASLMIRSSRSTAEHRMRSLMK